ncbi:sodium/proline symporter PutP [Porphyrobacter sp. TH134]|uniref:sodium/proline symporter PutP n=1 Tax=Porphyrobacter sp. TH134 TaxID=2067450 RepID=UPI000C7ADD9E|nr:sodium/proline symporter PutP [Porphyrobacter sp. TH134]PLK24776.1 sodium/proline symporter PutP [Porphyrobacter sp. TH134]
MNAYTLASLAAYFVLMIAIGVYAWFKTRADSAGYLLAGRGLGPAVTALSAGASDMSGWLLLGLPGALFAGGLVEAWIAIGLTIGAAANWIIVAPRLREQTERLGDALTIPQFLANRFPESGTLLRVVSAIIIVGFFTIYTASGMVGGGKLFETAFADVLPQADLSDYMLGIFITAGIVLVYTMIGGFLAVSLTDFVQGMIMMTALVVMPLVIFFGTDSAVPLSAVPQEGFLSLTHGATAIGIISAVTWGLGYFGQPHIIVRFMAIDRVENVPLAGWICMIWMVISLAGAVVVGLAGRAYAQTTGLVVDDPETIFILLGGILFHPAVTGFLYAALLAAIMSTISSQLLVSSSSLTEDFYRLFLRRNASEREAVNIGRLSVALVAAAALVIAADPDSEVLGLVANAWAGFGAAFGPLILLALTWDRMTGAGAVAGLVTGAGVVTGWIALGWNSTLPEALGGGAGLYEIMPGFIASLLAIVVVSVVTSPARTPA